MKRRNGYFSAGLIALLFWLVVVLAAAIGWGLNIYKMVGMSMDPLTGMFVGRVVGIFIAPLGAILGYL